MSQMFSLDQAQIVDLPQMRVGRTPEDNPWMEVVANAEHNKGYVFTIPLTSKGAEAQKEEAKKLSNQLRRAGSMVRDDRSDVRAKWLLDVPVSVSVKSENVTVSEKKDGTYKVLFSVGPKITRQRKPKSSD